MEIRNFQPGDEATQVEIYNAAAAQLPGFKPATVHEVKRRTTARDFDPAMRFFAVEGGKTVGYCTFNDNGRVSFPWCKPGHEGCAEQLFERVVETMKERNYSLAFAAYRADWQSTGDFFLGHGFHKAREMINYIQNILDMPTVFARPSSPVGPLQREDVPALFALAPEALRVKSAEQLEKYLFGNPYFSANDVFVLRNKLNKQIVAAAILITEATYADPAALDSLMPCFRLGAFGTEFMQTKRVKGLFSLLARPDQNFPSLALDLLSHGLYRLQDNDDLDALAGQVPSDVPHLVHFYQRHFQRQGSFPVYERVLQ